MDKNYHLILETVANRRTDDYFKCFPITKQDTREVEFNGVDALPGASVRNPTHDKVTQRGLMGKASQASGFPPSIS